MGASEPMVLRSPAADWQITSDSRQETATAVVRRREGAPILPELHSGTANPPNTIPSGPERHARAGAHWSDWTTTLKLPTVEPLGPALRAWSTTTPARSWPSPPPPCPRNRAASATGTTGTAGCATARHAPGRPLEKHLEWQHPSRGIESDGTPQVAFSRARRGDHLTNRYVADSSPRIARISP